MKENIIFDKNRLQYLLDAFLRETDAAGVVGKVYLVGGAALSLYYFDRDATRDIDAGFPQDPRIAKVILDIALRENLPLDWINSDSAMFFGFPPSKYWLSMKKIGNIELKVASPELLLAMKLKASRGRRDSQDAIELLAICKFVSVEQVIAVYEDVYAQEVMKDSAMELLQFHFK